MTQFYWKYANMDRVSAGPDWKY